MFILIISISAFLSDFITWHLITKRRIPYRQKLTLLTGKYFLKELYSLNSIMLYVAALLVALTGWFIGAFVLVWYAVSASLFAVACSKSVFKSWQKASHELGLKSRKTLLEEIPIASSAIASYICLIPVILTFLLLATPVMMNIAGETFIKSLPLPGIEKYFIAALNIQNTANQMKIWFSDFALLSSLFFALQICLIYYVYPFTISGEERNKLKRRLFIAIGMGLLCFVATEIYIQTSQPSYVGRNESSLLISLIIFFVTYWISRGFEEPAKQ